MVPRDTFRIVGVVTENEPPLSPVVGATVSISGGSGNDISTTSGEDGRFKLYGVAGDVELRIIEEWLLPIPATVSGRRTRNGECTVAAAQTAFGSFRNLHVDGCRRRRLFLRTIGGAPSSKLHGHRHDGGKSDRRATRRCDVRDQREPEWAIVFAGCRRGTNSCSR